MRPAPSTVIISPTIVRSYHSRLTVSIVSWERTAVVVTRWTRRTGCGIARHAIASARVYVGAKGEVDGYGLLASVRENRSCSPPARHRLIR